jgi:hypothetical protein
MALLNNVLVLCHGHKHRHIQEINYDTSTLVDIDSSNRPDYTLDVEHPQFSNNLNRQYDYVINAFCSIPTQFYQNEWVESPIGYAIDGALNPKFFNNIQKVLRPNGILYCRPLFRMYSYFPPKEESEDEKVVEDVLPNYQLFADKMFRFGFALVGINKQFSFETKIMNDFISFQKIPRPTRTDLWNYLQDRLTKQPSVRAITYRFHTKDRAHDFIEGARTIFIYVKDLVQEMEYFKSLFFPSADENIVDEINLLILITEDDRMARLW